MVDMVPEQSSATPKEMEIAGLIDFLMQPVCRVIASHTERGKVIARKEAEEVRAYLEQKMKRSFES